MKWSGKIVLIACLFAIPGHLIFCADGEKKTPRPAKRVFTNEDLESLHGADSAPEPEEESDLQSSIAKDGDKIKDATPSATDAAATPPQTNEQRLQGIQSTRAKLKDAKLNEVRAIQYLAAYQKKAQEAQDKFHKETAEAQTRDMEIHVTRLGEERKKLESQLEKLNQAAREAGIKEEELREKEAEPSSLPGTAQSVPPPAETHPAPSDNPNS